MPTTAETLALYRDNHRIHLQETEVRHEYRCSHDGIRVLPTRDGRWRHHPDDIAKLLELQYGGPFGSPQTEDERKAKAIERIVTLVDRRTGFEADYAVEDEDAFDYEGSPEFNGSFR